MTSIIMFLAGIVLFIGTLVSIFCSITQTPVNLRGFYGFFYSIISLGGLIGGVALVVFSFLA